MDAYAEFQRITRLVPINAGAVDWEALSSTALSPYLDAMEDTAQDPAYHAEGSVLAHTRAVCEALLGIEEYWKETERGRTVLFLAALLHDIGKIRCTTAVDGRIRSPHHASVGALMARELLWRVLGLCGTQERQQMREAICMLIRYHSFPPYAIRSEDPARSLLRIAANGELADDFNIRRLCILERADVLGRICADRNETLERVELCALLSEEAGCADAPYLFADDFSKRAYFKGKTAWKDQALYNDAWGEVTLLSGLPGTGKDTWIREHAASLPMLSLDRIRRELDVLPTENQGRVIALGYERARELLRRRQPFVWNATNITAQTRGGLISLFEEYGASVRTVFLETEWQEQLRRNAEREAEVPTLAIERMLAKLKLPERSESEQVLWLTV